MIPFDVLPAAPSASDARDRGSSIPERPSGPDDRFGGLLRDAVRDASTDRNVGSDRDRPGASDRRAETTTGRGRAEETRGRDPQTTRRPVHEALRLLAAGADAGEALAALGLGTPQIDPATLPTGLQQLLNGGTTDDATIAVPDELAASLLADPLVDASPLVDDAATLTTATEDLVDTDGSQGADTPVDPTADGGAAPALDAVHPTARAGDAGAAVDAPTGNPETGKTRPDADGSEQRLVGPDRARQVADARAAVHRADHPGSRTTAVAGDSASGASVDAALSTDAMDGVRTVAGGGEASGPIGAETLRAATGRSSLPAAANVQRVLDALELLEQAPPPRQLTIELGEARLRIGLEDGQVRLTLLGERNDALSRWLEETRMELSERGFDLFTGADDTGADTDTAGDGELAPDARTTAGDDGNGTAPAGAGRADDALRL